MTVTWDGEVPTWRGRCSFLFPPQCPRDKCVILLGCSGVRKDAPLGKDRTLFVWGLERDHPSRAQPAAASGRGGDMAMSRGQEVPLSSPMASR